LSAPFRVGEIIIFEKKHVYDVMIAWNNRVHKRHATRWQSIVCEYLLRKHPNCAEVRVYW
jgi:hypothetical protein